MPVQRTFPEYRMPAAWQPSVDICRGPSGWLYKIDLAGVRPEDIRVDLQERTLRVIGCRRDARLVLSAIDPAQEEQLREQVRSYTLAATRCPAAGG